MREWNSFDNALYEHFNTTFWKKVDSLQNFEEQMRTLETKLEEIRLTCLAGEKIVKVKHFEVRSLSFFLQLKK